MAKTSGKIIQYKIIPSGRIAQLQMMIIMTFFRIKVFLLFALCFISPHSKYVNNTSEAKSGKVFSLFR